MKSKKSKEKSLRVVELFAGVGGFRLGLCGTKERPLTGYDIVWSNQWEPATKKQHASDVYIARFGSAGHSNHDIAKVNTRDIPNHDILVGGFPCQDYSVARVLSQAKGLQGKKGVLWWEIHRILKEKKAKRPYYIMLENVDRLLKSPAGQRGRDFAIMLATLSDLGYAVEWRIINAADYGMPQRRRRIFILGYHKNSPIYKTFIKEKPSSNWLLSNGAATKAFPIHNDQQKLDLPFKLIGDAAELTAKFNKNGSPKSPFQNAGIMIERNVLTFNVKANHNKPPKTLGDILLHEKNIPSHYFVTKSELPKWRYLKGAKKEKRGQGSGHIFYYAEGPMIFPDPLHKPSRTIVTGEGGSTPSRFKHVVRTTSGHLRRLTPIELERLCMFPDNHTALSGISDQRRAFFMGNALVVGVVEKLGRSLLAMHRQA